MGFSNWLTTGVMTPNTQRYFARTPYFDNSVFTSDFMDPELTHTGDADYLYFDHHQNAFAYYSGHALQTSGQTEGQTYDQPCQSPGGNAYCATLPIPAQIAAQGATFPVFCQRAPGPLDTRNGHCAWTQYNRSIKISNTINGPPGRQGLVPYGGGLVKWGESNFSGTWAGAGTNGGANVVMLAISGAEYTVRGHEVWNAFGGVHLFANVLNHRGDTANTATRGSCFGMGYGHPTTHIATAWLDAVNCMPNQITVGQNACRNNQNTITYGGAKGYNGCGGHIITARGASSAEVNAHINETFANVTQDNPAFAPGDALGGQFWTSTWSCNWDCAVYPFDIP